MIEQGWKQLQSGFLNQLRQTIEGPLVYVYMSGGHHVLGQPCRSFIDVDRRVIWGRWENRAKGGMITGGNCVLL
ncbi:MAG TPA: hypothetical protein VKE24_14315 [Candidatus Acidoferrales bacterium]|nr:hypothetical protein [Candidatus Acidoferrales bacterium]